MVDYFIDYHGLMKQVEKVFSPEQLKKISDYCSNSEQKGGYYFIVDSQNYNMIINTKILEILCWLEDDAFDLSNAFYTGENLEHFLKNLKEDIF